MPLRDHFRPPLSDRRSWEGFHGGWPMMIVESLGPRLPARYIAEPQVHLGASIEVDVATYEDEFDRSIIREEEGEASGRATAWEPPEPTFAVVTDLGEPAESEVRVYETLRGRRLVAAIELVSPANKDRPDYRRAFVARCATLIRGGVCVGVVDVVTTRSANLYVELIEFFDLGDPSLGAEPSPLYAAVCRSSRGGEVPLLQTWAHPLELGHPLPTLPL